MCFDILSNAPQNNVHITNSILSNNNNNKMDETFVAMPNVIEVNLQKFPHKNSIWA
jgi:hypothetical protein